MRDAEHARFGHQNSPDLDMRALANRTAQTFLDDVVHDVVVVIFIGTECPDLCRDAAADKPIHHHVGILGIDPYAHVFDIVDGAGLISDDLVRLSLDAVSHRLGLKRFDAPHIAVQPVGGDGELRIVDLSLRQHSEQIVDADLLDPDVLVAEAATLSGSRPIADRSKIKKNALGGAAGGGQEFANKLRRLDFVTGLFQGLTDRRFLGGLVRIDHSGHDLGDPAILECRIVAAAADQDRHFELLDQHHRTGVGVEQQHRDRVTAFEIEAPLVGAHLPVILLMRDDYFVDFKEVVEQSLLAADFDATAVWHRMPRSRPVGGGSGNGAPSGNGEGSSNGGGSGIRTHDTVSRIHAFQASAFSHSATPPKGHRAQYTGGVLSYNPGCHRPRRRTIQ